MSNYTPGPWAANPIAARVDAFDPSGPTPICELLWPTKLRSEAETGANARLIAAAPNLLEALREYVRDFGDNEDDDSRLMADKARAAIAKATGET